jgi:hypothetical protein
MARAVLLHSSAHWKEGIDSSLWPLAVTYAVHVYNNTPHAQNLCPADLFTGSTVLRHRLKDLHTLGCPVYVLDPSLQAGQKLRRWEPRLQRGIFVCLSNIHSSEVPLILNLSIEASHHSITLFLMTVSLPLSRLQSKDDPPDHWEDLCLESTLVVPIESTANSPAHLHDDWLTDSERDLKQRDLQRQERIRQILHPTAPAPIPNHVAPSPITPINPTAVLRTTQSEGVQTPFVTTDAGGIVTMDRNAGTISLIVPTLSEEHSLSPTVNDLPPSMP